MEKAIALLQKIGFARQRSAADAGLSTFDLRLKKINRARQVSDARSMTFKSRPSPTKA